MGGLMYQSQKTTAGDTLFTDISFAEDLFYEMTFDTDEYGQFNSVVEVPANEIRMELQFPKTVYSTKFSYPEYNPQDYTYGLFTEK